MRKSFTLIALILSIVLGLYAAAFGQETTGNIEGTIKDSAGAIVPNVAVRIKNLTSVGAGQGFNRVVTTDDGGFFRVLQVPPGTYVVSTAAASGFGEYKNENVQITLGKTTQLVIELAAAVSVNNVNVTVS